ncbi:MAG: hypothetical protein ACRDRA_16575 [Pseudonocardiaceae bacterium]
MPEPSVGGRLRKVAREVRAQADELFRVATTDAEKVAKAARAEAQRLVAAATDTAAQRERASAHELHQLSRLKEEINSDLCRVKNVLDSLFGPTGTVAGTSPQAAYR